LDADTFADLEMLGADYDAAALCTPGISAYCSARDWSVSAAINLHPGRRPLVVRRGGYWLALTHGVHEQVGPYLQPMESDWGFASPILGTDTRVCVQLLWDALTAWESQWQVALLHGLTRGLANAAAIALDRRYRVVLRDGIRCQIASLEGGVDGFLARRSNALRRNLRRDERRFCAAGGTFDSITSARSIDAVVSRIMQVEAQSWKHGARQSVLASPRYRAFYTDALGRAQARGGLRACFATLDGRDVAYVFGGVLGDQYRGFQLGYDESLATFGLGNQVQLQMIRGLCAEGVQAYDLGMEMAYKGRWAERLQRLHTLVVVKPS